MVIARPSAKPEFETRLFLSTGLAKCFPSPCRGKLTFALFPCFYTRMPFNHFHGISYCTNLTTVFFLFSPLSFFFFLIFSHWHFTLLRFFASFGEFIPFCKSAFAFTSGIFLFFKYSSFSFCIALLYYRYYQNEISSNFFNNVSCDARVRYILSALLPTLHFSSIRARHGNRSPSTSHFTLRMNVLRFKRLASWLSNIRERSRSSVSNISPSLAFCVS